MGASAIREFRDHLEKNAYVTGNSELHNLWRVIEDNTVWRITTAGAAAATNWTPVESQKKSIVIPMGANWMELDGTFLAAFADGSNPQAGIAVDGSEAMGLRWNNHANPDAVITSVGIPPDLHRLFDITARIIAHKTGATVGDAVTFAVTAFFQEVGALYDADTNAGATTDAMTGDATSKTVQEVTAVIDAADIPTANGSMGITLQPTDGLLGTDDVTVTSLILEYNAVWG